MVTPDSLRCIGLMSGTSADGIDAVLVRFTPSQAQPSYTVENFLHVDFPIAYREQAAQVIESQNLKEAFILGRDLAQAYTSAIHTLLESTAFDTDDIDFVAVSGHTLLHVPPTEHQNGFTIDTTDLSMLAALTHIPVIGKFRQKDMALGGHGAPLVPIAHRYLFGQTYPNAIIQNMGGIGNLTLLENGQAMLGFDTGPGNTWMDQTIKWHSRGEKRYDPEGQYARRGDIDHTLVEDLLRHPFFDATPPKSTDIKDIGYPYLHLFKERLLAHRLEDALATVTFATAKSVAQAYDQWVFSSYNPTHVIVCGGGAFNQTLLAMLQELVPALGIETSQVLHLHPSLIETLSFAYLGVLCWQQQPNVLSRLTGSIQDNIGGEIAYAGSL
ncbi:MAG: anhydro-N-acetylmuramic acid kinase [Deltaproteobacteria bacterium]|nr:anhydro-N-acetylmuramic acid kinase [Deltaproteobacteria bacterium]